MTILLLSLTAAAQRYPVTVTPTLLPPYTLNLSELTAPASARLMATITVNDLTASNLPVRLHFKLESTGITIESIKTAAVAPLFLGGGETLVLTGSDMAQYLRLDNLDFRGYSKEQYRQTGQLPGGMWRLTIEVHHFHNHRVLSNRGTATVWVSIYDPPELTTPRNGTEAPDNASLPLIFNWQPSKHTGGTEAVQYKLQVWEMRMQGVPAQTVAASMTPIFETTTAATTYTAIPAAMNLEPGMQYCWRVTVFDPSGKAVINKNGQSEVREFTYLHTCPTVDEVTATVHNARVDFSWTPSPYHTHFQVELVGDNGVSELNDCYDSQFKLYDFPRGSTWKVRVRGECSGGLEADWSPWSDFEIDPPGTPPTPEECPNCGCDDAPKPRAITNYELKELHEGDTIENRTGRTRFIVLTAVPNGDGSYNGQFYLWLELWKTKVRCDYTDLKVNTDGVIFDGQWRSVRNDGLMVNPAAVAEAVESIKNNVAAATYDNYIRDTIKFTYPIQTIYKDQNDNYIAVLADGTELDVTQRLSNAGHTLIEDSEGNQMAVTGDHRLMSAEQYHKTGKNNTLLKNDSQAKDKQIAASGDVIFKPSGNQQYGFDAYDASTNNHPEIYPLLEGGSYRPAYKSVAQWQQDKVTAEPMQGVTFRNQMGVPYATTSDDIILRGEPQPGETPVYAHMAETDSTTKVVGKLNLLTFEPKEIQVCLVPVNGATLPNTQTLEKELNKIFKPAVASVKVSTHAEINIEYANGSGFVHGGSGPLTVYSDDEKAAINALTDADDDTYYLFLVSSVTKLDADGNNTVVSGYMPVGYQHGFIFEQFDVARTFAHELSHGAFALHHTFSANTESFHADEGTTNNLMDYTEHGIALNHKQWRWMHENHGKGLFGFLADEEEGEYTTDGHYYLFTYLGMLMGMNPEQAEEYGKWAEEPDSRVTNARDMEEQISWLIGNLQQRNHALTGGEHGVELAATAYAITHYLTDENKKYLFHRFGDCYAHLKISNDSKGFANVALEEYIKAFENYIKDNFSFVRANNEQLKMSDGKIITIQPNEIVYDKKYITSIPRDKFVQMLLRKILTADSEGGLDSEYQKAFRLEYRYHSGILSYLPLEYPIFEYPIFEYAYSDIVSDLKKHLPQATQNSYEMYGADQEGLIDSWCTVNFGHTFDGLVNIETEINIPLIEKKIEIKIGGNPDAIVRRKELFSLYTRHLYQLLNMINKIEGADENSVCGKIDSIVEWASKKGLKDARFDGIFAFEIMCLNEKIDPKNAHGKQVLIPVKYLNEENMKSDWAAFVYYSLIANLSGDADKQRDILNEYTKDLYGLTMKEPYKSQDKKTIIIEFY